MVELNVGKLADDLQTLVSDAEECCAPRRAFR